MAARYTHAGGVVFRNGPAGLEYLIVEARRSRGTWVLPKGHIEEGETAEETAAREVQEEAGSSARVIERLGRVEFGAATVAFFLMHHLKDVPPDENRRVRWCTYEEVLERVAFDDIRRILKRAQSRIAKNGMAMTQVASARKTRS
ncbi:MAG: NUDIX domain-containing protein [Vicinamibacterales bacterium]